MTGTEECSAKMAAPSPHPTPPSSIWKHGAGRNCLSRGKVWNRTVTQGEWGFSQAAEQEVNERRQWAVWSFYWICTGTIRLFRKSNSQSVGNFWTFHHFAWLLSSPLSPESDNPANCSSTFIPVMVIFYVYLVNERISLSPPHPHFRTDTLIGAAELLVMIQS